MSELTTVTSNQKPQESFSQTNFEYKAMMLDRRTRLVTIETSVLHIIN